MRDSDFQDVLFYGVIFVILIVVLFLASKFLSWFIGSRVRARSTEFGISATDFERLKQKAGLTPEEEKAVKTAMARRMLERVKAEEKIRKLPPKAAVVLAGIDKERALEMKATEDPEILPKPIKPAVAGNASASEKPPMVTYSTPTPTVEPAVFESASELPPELQAFLDYPDVELDNLCHAGFLSETDVLRVKRARAAS